MYQITNHIFISFAHHVRGHSGPCISLHGHTWKFEVTLCADVLDGEGFVVDFGQLRKKVLIPCHDLLDHSMAMGEHTWSNIYTHLAPIGEELRKSRLETIGQLGEQQNSYTGLLNGAKNEFPGGIKVAIFPFSPTSERLAEWLYILAKDCMEDGRIKVARARIYESLHPTESMAEYGG
ncbi:MAG: 6-carboxytetrahydropterin synthase [Holophagaceae bacterium]|nr:6-carboxytetrahydropterin synthase [Holophagaceae bacterium]